MQGKTVWGTVFSFIGCELQIKQRAARISANLKIIYEFGGTSYEALGRTFFQDVYKRQTANGTKFLILHSTDDKTISLKNSVLANVEKNDNITLKMCIRDRLYVNTSARHICWYGDSAGSAGFLYYLSFKPVSYTHLDVYKRQGWYLFRSLRSLCSQAILFHTAICGRL